MGLTPGMLCGLLGGVGIVSVFVDTRLDFTQEPRTVGHSLRGGCVGVDVVGCLRVNGGRGYSCSRFYRADAYWSIGQT